MERSGIWYQERVHMEVKKEETLMGMKGGGREGGKGGGVVGLYVGFQTKYSSRSCDFAIAANLT